MSATLTAEAVATRISDRLRQRYGVLRNGAKHLARAAGVTPRAAENWLAGLNAPRSTELIRLMASCDEIAAEVLQLVEEARKCSRS